MVKLTGRPANRVITISANNLSDLDKWTSELLDIIDSWGGTNPYPRFFVTAIGGESYFYSCTTKIPTLNLENFDKEIKEWNNK